MHFCIDNKLLKTKVSAHITSSFIHLFLQILLIVKTKHPSKKREKNQLSQKQSKQHFVIGLVVMLFTTLFFVSASVYLASHSRYSDALAEELLSKGIPTKATVKRKHTNIQKSLILETAKLSPEEWLDSVGQDTPHLRNIDPKWEFVDFDSLDTTYFLEITYHSGDYDDPLDGFNFSLGDFLDDICIPSRGKDCDAFAKQREQEKLAQKKKTKKSLEPAKKHRWAIEVSKGLFDEVKKFERIPALYLDGQYDSIRLLKKDGSIDKPDLRIWFWICVFLSVASLIAVINGVRTGSWK